MAFIQNTAFEIKVSDHEFDAISNVTGVYQTAGGENDVCSAGQLVVRGEQYDSQAFAVVKNDNAWYMNDAGADATDNIYACNTFNVQEMTDGMGNVYKIGHNTLGLAAPAGVPVTFTNIHFDGQHQYVFGIGNVNGTIGTNKFFTIAGGQLVPAAAAPATGTPYFKLLKQGAFTAGTQQAFDYVWVQAFKA